MTKTFCNKCKKELNPREVVGQLAYIKKTLIPNINASQPDEPTIEQMQAHFCEKCLETIIKLIK